MKHKSGWIGGRIYWPGSPLLAALLVLLFLLLRVNRRKKMNTINDTGKDVYLLLIENGFTEQLSRYLTAQAAHETANFTSQIFVTNNNLFGMKLPKVRKTTATGEKYGHATFDSLTDSIKDMKLYLKAHKLYYDYNSIEQYIKAIFEHGYFEALKSEYVKGVKHFYTLYFG
jgi:hypothetical protein